VRQLILHTLKGGFADAEQMLYHPFGEARSDFVAIATVWRRPTSGSVLAIGIWWGPFDGCAAKRPPAEAVTLEHLNPSAVAVSVGTAADVAGVVRFPGQQ
jgi:hypothetical protein